MSMSIEVFPTLRANVTFSQLQHLLLKDEPSFLSKDLLINLKVKNCENPESHMDNVTWEIGSDYEFSSLSENLFFLSLIENDSIADELDILKGFNMGCLTDDVLKEVALKWHNLGYSMVAEIKSSNNILDKLRIIAAIAILINGVLCVKNDLPGLKSGLYFPSNFNKLVDVF